MLERVTTGIPALDESMDCGIQKDNAVLLLGLTGSGKTSIKVRRILLTNIRGGLRSSEITGADIAIDV